MTSSNTHCFGGWPSEAVDEAIEVVAMLLLLLLRASPRCCSLDEALRLSATADGASPTPRCSQAASQRPQLPSGARWLLQEAAVGPLPVSPAAGCTQVPPRAPDSCAQWRGWTRSANSECTRPLLAPTSISVAAGAHRSRISAQPAQGSRCWLGEVLCPVRPLGAL